MKKLILFLFISISVFAQEDSPVLRDEENLQSETISTGKKITVAEKTGSAILNNLRSGGVILNDGTPGLLAASLTTEDFEGVFPPAGWTRGIVSGAANYWTKSLTITGYGMSSGAAKYDFFNSANTNVEYLQTPDFSPTISGEVLQFDAAWSPYTDGHEKDTLQILTSADGTNYSVLATYFSDSNLVNIPFSNYLTTGPKSSSSANIQDSYWITKRISLPEGTISIRFLAYSGLGNNLFLDNISTLVPPPAGTPLSGTYTIDPSLPVSSTNYQTFTSAAYDLSNNGVSSAVVFNVSPVTYNERFYILPISGSSPVNTVTFQNANPGGGVNPVISAVNSTATSSTSDYAISLIGCDWVTFNGIDIVDAGTTTATKTSRGIVLGSYSGIDGADNNTIENCNITLGGGGVTEGFSIGIVGTGNVQGMAAGTIDSNTINNCKIDNADRGIGFFATLGASNIAYPFMHNNAVTNNRLGSTLSLGMNSATGGSPIGIIIQGVSNAVCTGNIIDSIKVINPASTAAILGITLQISSGVVSGNKIRNILHANTTSTSATIIGIEASPTTSGIAYVNNNTVTGVKRKWTGANSATVLISGLLARNYMGVPSQPVFFTNNSVFLSNSDTINYSSAALRTFTLGLSVSSFNNILYNSLSSSSTLSIHYAVHDINTDRSILNSNYNNLNSTGTNAGIGRYGTTTTLTLNNWQTNGGVRVDWNSLSGLPVFLPGTDFAPDTTNEANWVINGRGVPLTFVPEDINGSSRSTDVLNGSADIGAYEFNMSGVEPPEANASGAPSPGTTTVYRVLGDTVCAITWGPDGTVPTSVSLKSYPGEDPPGTYSPDIKFGNIYYDIQASGGSGYTYDITLYFSYPLMGTIQDENAVRISKSDNGTNWTTFNDAIVNTTDYTVTKTGLTSFSLFALSDENAPLPVELSSFTAASEHLNAVIKWKTVSEVDNFGFEVERKSRSPQSTNGSQPQWEKAGFVKGNGNSNSPKEYVYTDNQLPAGKYLYRLKQIDNDGTFRYSEEIEVEVGAAPLEFNLSQNYPNPFNPETMINFTVAENGLTTLKIFNILGEEQAALFNEMAEAGKYQQVKFDASNLPSGIYFARLQSGNHQMIKKMMLLK